MTAAGGGAGPWVYLFDRDPVETPTRRLRETLHLRPDEDLWVELAFYPDRASMRRTIKRVWQSPHFAQLAAELDNLLSVRLPGYDATLAVAVQVNV